MTDTRTEIDAWQVTDLAWAAYLAATEVTDGMKADPAIYQTDEAWDAYLAARHVVKCAFAAYDAAYTHLRQHTEQKGTM